MDNADINSRARVYYSNLFTQSCKQIDRMFAYLMLLQFAAGVLIAAACRETGTSCAARAQRG